LAAGVLTLTGFLNLQLLYAFLLLVTLGALEYIIRSAPGQSLATSSARPYLIGYATIAYHLYDRQTTAWFTLGLIVVFVGLPGLFSGLAARASAREAYLTAARWQRLAYVFYPANGLRNDIKLLNARSRSPEDFITTLEQVIENAPEHVKPIYSKILAFETDDWAQLLHYSRMPRARDVSLELRALGELGRVDELVTTYRALAPSISNKTERANIELFMAVFNGLPDHVAHLFASDLKSLNSESQRYWSSRAALIAHPENNTAKTSLSDLAVTATQPMLRRRAATAALTPWRKTPFGADAVQAIENVRSDLESITNYEKSLMQPKRYRQLVINFLQWLVLIAILTTWMTGNLQYALDVANARFTKVFGMSFTPPK
jgi:hypothetical protein